MARRGKERDERHTQLTAINIHRATPTGPAIAHQQGGDQYADVKVKAGSLRSAPVGRGAGRGSPHRSNQ